MYKIVIADDDEILLQGLTTVFNWENIGIEVCASVTDGDQALEAVKKYHPDILLTDIKMTNMDGLTLATQIKEEQIEVTVVIMSAYNEFSFAQQALRLAVTDYLVKPIDLEVLEKLMRQIVEKKTIGVHRDAKVQRIVEENYIDSDEKIYTSSHTLNKGMIEYIAKLVLCGNIAALPEYLEMFKKNLYHTGNTSKLMFSFAMSIFFVDLNRISTEIKLDAIEIFDDYSEQYKVIIEKPTLEDAICQFEEMVIKFAEKIADRDIITNSQLMKRACKYIEEKYREPEFRVTDVAEYVGLSPNYFSAIFKECMGKTYTEYLVEIRMKLAQELIVNTDYKTSEIAAMTGYDNATYFCTSFKKFVGITVSRYRECIKS